MDKILYKIYYIMDKLHEEIYMLFILSMNPTKRSEVYRKTMTWTTHTYANFNLVMWAKLWVKLQGLSLTKLLHSFPKNNITLF